MLENRPDRLSEGFGVVPDEDVAAVLGGQTFAADCGAHHRLPHRPCVQDLEARAPANPERHDVAGGVAHVGADIRHIAGELHRVAIAVVATNLVRGTAAQPTDRRRLAGGTHLREDRVAEILQGVAMREPIDPPTNTMPSSRPASGRKAAMSTPFGTAVQFASGAMRCSSIRSASETRTLR